MKKSWIWWWVVVVIATQFTTCHPERADTSHEKVFQILKKTKRRIWWWQGKQWTAKGRNLRQHGNRTLFRELPELWGIGKDKLNKKLEMHIFIIYCIRLSSYTLYQLSNFSCDIRIVPQSYAHLLNSIVSYLVS